MVRFSCACGRRLKVDAAHAGRAVQCPSCGTRLTVPHPQEAAAGASEALAQAARKQNRSAAAPAPRAMQGVDALTEALRTTPAARRPTTAAQSGLPTGRPPAGHQSRKPFIIGLGAAVVVLILLVALSVFLGGRGSTSVDESANAKTTTAPPSSAQRAAPKAGGAGELFKNVPFQEQKD